MKHTILKDLWVYLFYLLLVQIPSQIIFAQCNINLSLEENLTICLGNSTTIEAIPINPLDCSLFMDTSNVCSEVELAFWDFDNCDGGNCSSISPNTSTNSGCGNFDISNLCTNNGNFDCKNGYDGESMHIDGNSEEHFSFQISIMPSTSNNIYLQNLSFQAKSKLGGDDDDDGPNSIPFQLYIYENNEPNFILGETVLINNNWSLQNFSLDLNPSVLTEYTFVIQSLDGELYIDNLSLNGICCQQQITEASEELTYLWSTGESTASIDVNNPGIYSVEVTSCNNNCSILDSIEVSTQNCAGLGNQVFMDENYDGLYNPDSGDYPLEEIIVKLYNAEDLTVILSETTSGNGGYYVFNDLDPEINYVLFFELPNELDYALQSGNANDYTDHTSDVFVNGLNNGYTELIELAPGEFNSTIDAGFVPIRSKLNLKILLQGPSEFIEMQNSESNESPETSNTFAWRMRDDIRVAQQMPIAEPYNDMEKFTHIGDDNVGFEVIGIPATILLDDLDKSLVDWIFIEIRDPSDVTQIVQTKSALLRRDGTVIDAHNNSADLAFSVPAGDYYVAIYHRNHLGVMSQNTITLNPTNPNFIDFTNPNLEVWGNNSMKFLDNNTRALWAGNAFADNQITLQGINNDPNIVFFEILEDSTNANSQINFASQNYYNGDTNMDCNSVYQGWNNDVNLIMFNVIQHPENLTGTTNYIIMEQIPE